MQGSGRRDRQPRQGAALIRFKNVSRCFGATLAVSDLSLDIREGEIFCLLGPSGCGKTTLMRMLAGFEAPDEGRVLLDEVDLAGVPPHRRPLNMMFQSYALFPHLTVVDNIGFGLRQAGGARETLEARIRELVALVQLEGLERRKPSQLSGGQRQRVALARALARQPRVLLLDEPLAALDRKIREETQFQLMHIQKELGTTFLIVTHDQDEAMVMADRIGVMEAGRLVQVGTPEDIYERPVSRSVAAFIGDINLIDGVVEAVDGQGQATVRPRSMEGALLVAAGDGLQRGSEVAVAIRPESWSVSPGADSPRADNQIAAEIIDIAYRGDWSMLFCRTVDGSVIKAAVSGAARQSGLSPGQAVTLRFAPGSARVLTR